MVVVEAVVVAVVPRPDHPGSPGRTPGTNVSPPNAQPVRKSIILTISPHSVAPNFFYIFPSD